MNYPIIQNKTNWRLLQPTHSMYSEEYTSSRYDLYLTTEYIRDEYNNPNRYYRLHANKPHSIEMALAYDIKCPLCGHRYLKQVGRCKDRYTLGLYECPKCDKDNRGER